jgi:hypothetical protein
LLRRCRILSGKACIPSRGKLTDVDAEIGYSGLNAAQIALNVRVITSPTPTPQAIAVRRC